LASKILVEAFDNIFMELSDCLIDDFDDFDDLVLISKFITDVFFNRIRTQIFNPSSEMSSEL
jgi:hypothetical protein